jgi:2-desacetyl-2-hydroxyethyl bacteriochlorophyllide A dehydrogenase
MMKAGEIRLIEKPVEPPQPDQVQVAVKYVCICGSDIARFDGRLPSHRPVVFGHEYSGRVQKLGKLVSGMEIGQPVTVAPLLNCGNCDYCLTDRGYMCAERVLFGSEVDGALCDYVNVPFNRVFPLPTDLPLEYGALVEPLAIAIHAVKQSPGVEGKTIIVLGGGAIGLLISLVCRAADAHRLIVLDIDPGRVALAKQLGLQAVDNRAEDWPRKVLAITGDIGADVLFEAAGVPEVVPQFLQLLAPFGTLVIVGRLKEPVPINLDHMLFKEAQITTSRYFSMQDFKNAVEMVVQGEIPSETFLQARYPFHQIDAGQGSFMMEKARRALRLVIDLNAGEEDY